MSAGVRAWVNRIGLWGIHLGALTGFLPGVFHWSGPIVAAVLLHLTGGLGVTLCYHRSLTHRGLRMRKWLEYTFAVLGDRFRLQNPENVVYTVFPEDNGNGEYTTVLPHVVFTKSTFPWTRYPTSSEPEPPPPPGSSTDANVPTWLAVLLFDADDVTEFPSLSPAPHTNIPCPYAYAIGLTPSLFS